MATMAKLDAFDSTTTKIQPLNSYKTFILLFIS